MFYTPRNSVDDTGGLYLQKVHINFLNTISTIPPLPTVFWVEPQTNKLFYHPKEHTVHGIYTNSINSVKTWQL